MFHFLINLILYLRPLIHHVQHVEVIKYLLDSEALLLKGFLKIGVYVAGDFFDGVHHPNPT